MHYQLIFFVFCFFICPLHAMHPEIISDSQKRFENMPFVFTLTDAFAKQKCRASDLIASLIIRRIPDPRWSDDSAAAAWGTETPPERLHSKDKSYLPLTNVHGKIITTASPNKQIMVVYNPRSARNVIRIIKGEHTAPLEDYNIPITNNVTFMKPNHDGSLLVAHDYNTLLFIETKTGKILQSTALYKVMNSGEFSEDSSFFASGGGNGRIDIIDTTQKGLGTILISLRNVYGTKCVGKVFPNGQINITDYGNFNQHILDVHDVMRITNTLSLAQYHLIEAFRIAKRDFSRIHANNEQWQTWLRLQQLLPDYTINRLKPYIVNDDPLNGYETAEENT